MHQGFQVGDNFSSPFSRENNASSSGLGAVLSQEQDASAKPVHYASLCLKPIERKMDNSSSMRLEFLAVKWTMSIESVVLLTAGNITVV